MINLHKGDAIAVTKYLLEQGQRWDYCLTSPPYYALVDYSHPQQIGHESTAGNYIDAMWPVFENIYRGMTDNGVMWLNIGDTRSNDSVVTKHGRRGEVSRRRSVEPGTKRGSLIGIPHRLLEQCKLIGWHHAHTYIWWRGINSSSQPCDGRPQEEHEYIFALVKSTKSRPKPRSTFGGSLLHCAPERSNFPCKMPLSLAHLLLSKATDKGTVIDPFIGSGTTAISAHQRGFDCIGIDIDLAPASAAVQGIQAVLPI